MLQIDIITGNGNGAVACGFVINTNVSNNDVMLYWTAKIRFWDGSGVVVEVIVVRSDERWVAMVCTISNAPFFTIDPVLVVSKGLISCLR